MTHRYPLLLLLDELCPNEPRCVRHAHYACHRHDAELQRTVHLTEEPLDGLPTPHCFLDDRHRMVLVGVVPL